jgi:hypothetical protein
MRRAGHNLRHVLVVGTGEPARMLLTKIRRHPISASASTASWPPPPPTSAARSPTFRPRGRGSAAAVARARRGIIYLALERRGGRPRRRRSRARRLHRHGAARTDLSHAFQLNATVEDFDGMPVVLVTEPEQGWNAW